MKMCMIIDANAAHEIASAPVHQDARPVLRWLTSKRGALALGGKLTDELYRTPFRRLLVEFTRSGVAKTYRNQHLSEMEDQVGKSKPCISDDLHIIALALVSGARILYSRDEKLHVDFRSPAVINNPRGHVYSSVNHTHLLLSAPSCQ